MNQRSSTSTGRRAHHHPLHGIQGAIAIDEVLYPGARVRHLDGPELVEVMAVNWIGDAADVSFRHEFGPEERRMLLPADLALLAPADAGPTFAADPDRFRLAIEAFRVRHAHLLDPYMAVSAANVEPLPHQLLAVYDEMLTQRPLRFLLADDPGAGKTIMCGLLVKELLARGAIRRCLIVAPGGLVDQWQDELQFKFGLHFPIFDRDMLGSPNPFVEHNLLIARVDQLARSDELRNLLAESSWDLTVFDEAHKLAAGYWGSTVRKTKRYELGEVAAGVSDNLLLMTATPHNGKEDEFQLFLALLDPERYAGKASRHDGTEVDDLMRRLVKEQLVHVDGRPLFPERRASTVTYDLSPREAELYERVSDYVRHEMDKVAGDERRRSVTFALLVLQRRLASSPQAILTSLGRRRDRLNDEIQRAGDRDATLGDRLVRSLDARRLDDDESLRPAEREQAEEEFAATATAARTAAEIEAEVRLLDELVALAQEVLGAGVDRKWDALERLLTSDRMFASTGDRRKIIVFTEHRDTLDYLEDRIGGLLGSPAGIEIIHGGVSRHDRRLAQQNFIDDPDATVLLATDAAGEGVNLQVAHLMVNYDIPWNPNRLEQRFGRIHRIGQTEVCHLWNLVARDTREGDVFETLLTKLDVQRAALGDRVFDVLGEVLSGKDLRSLLTEAVRYGDRPDVRARLEQTLTQRVDADLRTALDQREASVGELSHEDLVRLRHDMSVSTAHRLQPVVVEDFVRAALDDTHADLVELPDHRLSIRHVPPDVRTTGEVIGRPLDRRYAPLTFLRGAIDVRGRPPAQLLAPGHPLVDVLVEHELQRGGRELVRGATFRDDWSDEDYLVATFRHTIRSPSESWPPSNRVVTLASGRECRPVDAAIYTSLPARSSADVTGPIDDLLDRAQAYANDEVVPGHAEALRSRFDEMHRRIAADVERRLGTERKALEERLGRTSNDLDDAENQSIRDRIQALDRRLQHRLAELEEHASMDVADPELVALAYVHGTAEPDVARTYGDAHHAVGHHLADAVLEVGRPFGGYDFMIDRGNGHEFVTVARMTGTDVVELNRSEVIAARNLGPGHLLAVVDEDGTITLRETIDMVESADTTRPVSHHELRVT